MIKKKLFPYFLINNLIFLEKQEVLTYILGNNFDLTPLSFTLCIEEFQVSD